MFDVLCSRNPKVGIKYQERTAVVVLGIRIGWAVCVIKSAAREKSRPCVSIITHMNYTCKSHPLLATERLALGTAFTAGYKSPSLALLSIIALLQVHADAERGPLRFAVQYVVRTPPMDGFERWFSRHEGAMMPFVKVRATSRCSLAGWRRSRKEKLWCSITYN